MHTSDLDGAQIRPVAALRSFGARAIDHQSTGRVVEPVNEGGIPGRLGCLVRPAELGTVVARNKIASIVSQNSCTDFTWVTDTAFRQRFGAGRGQGEKNRSGTRLEADRCRFSCSGL
jgi:hypothetical protein